MQLMMDASMYELCSSSSTLLDDRRHHMTLDFAAASPRKCFSVSTTPAHVACSNVASPDLESFLLYASAGGGGGELDWADNTSGTPTQVLFPSSVTAEQEAYARGFVDALEELHRRQGVPAVTAAAQSVVWTQSSSSSWCSTVSCRTADVPSYQLSSCSLAGGRSSSVSSAGSSVGGRSMGGPGDVSRVVSSQGDVVDGRCRLSAVDDGVQTVPRLSCLTPPSSPDTDAVELARIDRKRERNRLAAQKCRSRKLEQIVVLESRCAMLRAENEALSRTAGQLGDNVALLKHALAEHTAGSQCRINSTFTSTQTSNDSAAAAAATR